MLPTAAPVSARVLVASLVENEQAKGLIASLREQGVATRHVHSCRDASQLIRDREVDYCIAFAKIDSAASWGFHTVVRAIFEHWGDFRCKKAYVVVSIDHQDRGAIIEEEIHWERRFHWDRVEEVTQKVLKDLADGDVMGLDLSIKITGKVSDSQVAALGDSIALDGRQINRCVQDVVRRHLAGLSPYSQFHIEEFRSSGKSKSYMVDIAIVEPAATDDSARYRYLAKILRQEKAAVEFRNYRRFIQSAPEGTFVTLMQHVQPFYPKVSVLIYEKKSRVAQLEDRLKLSRADRGLRRRLVRRTFERLEAAWYQRARVVSRTSFRAMLQARFGDEYEGLLGTRLRELAENAEREQAERSALPAGWPRGLADALAKRLAARPDPAFAGLSVTAHGDLHFRNVLVEQSGRAPRPVVIDYGDIAEDQYLLRDFAKAEVDLLQLVIAIERQPSPAEPSASERFLRVAGGDFSSLASAFARPQADTRVLSEAVEDVREIAAEVFARQWRRLSGGRKRARRGDWRLGESFELQYAYAILLEMLDAIRWIKHDVTESGAQLREAWLKLIDIRLTWICAREQPSAAD